MIASVVTRLETMIAVFAEQIEDLETELEGQLPTSGEWGTNCGLLLSIKGIGRWTALWLLVATVNFTSCATAAEAVGYAGLAPAQHTSGTSVRGREHLPRGGHARLRTALYMATLSAAQHNRGIAAFYARLVAAGKPKKVARCAAARKLLHLAWAVVAKQQAYDPAYGQAKAPAAGALAA